MNLLLFREEFLPGKDSEMTIHPELTALVNWTWANKDTIMQHAQGSSGGRPKGLTHMRLERDGENQLYTHNRGIDMIYDHYAFTRKKRKVKVEESKAIENFLTQLEARYSEIKRLAPAPTIALQAAKGLDIINSLADLKARSDLKGRFIHFIKEDRSVTDRIYVNLRNKHRGQAFGRILKRIWDVEGMSSAKIEVPGGGPRADAMVIYCRNEKTTEEVVGKIRGYQAKHPDFFGGSLPKLVKHFDGLKGVGYGKEPPRMLPIRTRSGRFLGKATNQQSFGRYRATLIFIALEQTEFPQTVDPLRMRMNFSKHADPVAARTNRINHSARNEFERNVKIVFERAGISVEDPYKQEEVKWDKEKDEPMGPPPGPPPAKPAGAAAPAKKGWSWKPRFL
ncbi:hypothetical protein FMN50_24095 [Rhodobacterales bacterium]|nr:hypothetical protein FMN50_24095 [Rhodobacterales bacterium]